MSLDLSWVGRELGPSPIAWSPGTCMLYALGVGAGVDEPQFTTENSRGVRLRVLPTFATSISRTGWGDLEVTSFGSYGPHQAVHAAQKLELGSELPPAARALATLRVEGIYDKRVGAVVELVTTAVSPESGEELFRSTTSLFIVGEGGFGGPRGGQLAGPRPPRRPADHTVVQVTRPDQALLFRLSGDHSPICATFDGRHSDLYLRRVRSQGPRSAGCARRYPRVARSGRSRD